MLAYLVGTGIMGTVWLALFLLRKDLRKTMLWSGIFYISFLTIGFIGYRLVFDDPVRSITPGYWEPPTLFDLGQLTRGYGIEDALFMFFAGGTAASLFEVCFRKRLSEERIKSSVKRYALLIGVLAAGLFHMLVYLNDIYLLIAFNFVGALVVLWQRRDLALNIFWGGGLFVLAYALQFLLFNALYPDFIDNYYNLHATSGVMLLGIPLEEYLYAFSFGLLWAPLYKYLKQLKASG